MKYLLTGGSISTLNAPQRNSQPVLQLKCKRADCLAYSSMFYFCWIYDFLNRKFMVFLDRLY